MERGFDEKIALVHRYSLLQVSRPVLPSFFAAFTLDVLLLTLLVNKQLRPVLPFATLGGRTGHA